MPAETEPLSLAGTLIDRLEREAALNLAYRGNACLKLSSAAPILSADVTTQVAVVHEAILRVSTFRQKLGPPQHARMRYMNLSHELWYPRATVGLMGHILRRRLPFTQDDLVLLLRRTADLEMLSTFAIGFLPHLVALIERQFDGVQPPTPIVLEMSRIGKALEWISNAPERKLRERIERFCGGPLKVPLLAGEAWSDRAIADLEAMDETSRTNWINLLSHCGEAKGSTPSQKWISMARDYVKQIKNPKFGKNVVSWFELLAQPRTQHMEAPHAHAPDPDLLICEPHMDVLKGLAWCCGIVGSDDICRALTRLTLSAYRKVPNIGPRAVRVGNACIYALRTIGSEIAIAQLAMLKVKVRFGTAQKEIEKAFTTVAVKLNVPRDQIEEMGVPSYGLEEVGEHRETVGDYRAELIVTGSDAKLNWLDAKTGKTLKSAPAKVKTAHKEEFKELQQSLKDIQAMLPAQRDRIDSLFLLQKTWTIDQWRERYLDHPLIGTIARRLIWCVDRTPVIFIDGKALNVEGKSTTHGTTAEIMLWHPVGQAIDDITAWRRRLEELNITQPFKQAHRELYILTDAERRTHTYSNRFASHVIRQHQFNALCAARGWKNKLRLLVDDTYPPAIRHLPVWGMRAEFWIEGIGTDYGTDTNDSGVFLRLATDQVRFYRMEAAQSQAHAGGGGYGATAGGPGTDNINEPIALDQVPPLVLSEIMRDVDLFVGVASVGNDPNWQDGGPEGRHQTYWQSYAFGELNESAKTRRQVLERIIPRLKFADRCSFADKFLIVRGDKRTYKIHLGSGNILMEPNDQYLCIVPDQRARTNGENKLFLPFEGDNTLSIIISKAMLLAEDKKISDSTILRQIER